MPDRPETALQDEACSANRSRIALSKERSGAPRLAPKRRDWPGTAVDESTPFGHMRWYTTTSRTGKPVSLASLTDGSEYRLVHTTMRPRATRGYVYFNNDTPDSRVLSFSVEYSPAERRNDVRIIRIGPYSGDLVNGQIHQTHNVAGSPALPNRFEIRTPAEYILAALTVIGDEPFYWRKLDDQGSRTQKRP